MVQTFLLHCVDTEWAIRLLVGTYVDEGLFEQALHELQNLPNTPENAEFIALYQAIIEGGLGEQGGSGKAGAATATVSAIAQNAISANSSLAQSMLAVYKNANYIRHGETVNLPEKSLATEPAFKLLPNPAQDQITVLFTKAAKPLQTLEIYDLQGRLVLVQKDIVQNTIVNVAMLQTGMYFCRLSAEADVVKLAVVR